MGHGYKRQILHTYNIHVGKNVSRSYDCLVLGKRIAFLMILCIVSVSIKITGTSCYKHFHAVILMTISFLEY